MAALTLEDAALEAIEAEAARAGGYAWPERSCVSLIEEMCRRAGSPAPDYAEARALPERRCMAAALARHGTLARAHGAILAATGAWVAVPPDLPVAGRICALSGDVHGRDGTVYRPPRPGCELLALVGPDGMPWMWSPNGLTYAISWGGVALEWECRSE